MVNNDKWGQLSWREKADLIKLYVDNGIINLKTIKEDYNSFEESKDLNKDK